jgi:2-polyprenyl-3-methyl-5-hydroxy-6-metoxy-1,4-benzoquinol methylase
MLTHPLLFCPVCNSSGIQVHKDLHDQLFGVPGTWNIDQCQNKKCKTVWLNPYPNTEIIPSFYTDYHTHNNIPLQKDADSTRRKNIIDRMRNAYLYTRYGYGKYYKLNWFFNLLSYIHPGWQDARAANHFYIPRVANGIFLDVGCGAGGSLAAMRDRGWRTYGIDFDKKAIEVAKNHGLECATGGLLEQNFPSSYFDAVLLSHVIEHVPNPREIISECYRILKPGGTLSLITPNIGSWSYKLFGKNWRGLEAPRHLQIFTPKSLKNLAHQASFSKVQAFSSPHGEMFFIRESRKISFQRKKLLGLENKLMSSRIIEHACLFFFGWFNLFFPERCGMAVVVCTK